MAFEELRIIHIQKAFNFHFREPTHMLRVKWLVELFNAQKRH